MGQERCTLCGFEIAADEPAYILDGEVVCSVCNRNAARSAPKVASAGTPSAAGFAVTPVDPIRDTRILNDYAGRLRFIGRLFLWIGIVAAVVCVIAGVVLAGGALLRHQSILIALGSLAAGCLAAVICYAIGYIIMSWFFLRAAYVAAFSSIAHNTYSAAVNKA